MLSVRVLIGLGLCVSLPPDPAPVHTQPPAKRTDALGDPLPEHALVRLGTVRLRHGDAVLVINYFPEGKKLISGGGDGAASVWDAGTGRLLRTLQPAGGPAVTSLAVSADGKSVVVATRLPRVFLHDAATGQVRRSLQPAARAAELRLSPDGQRLAILDAEGTLSVWDLTPAVAKCLFQDDSWHCVAAGFSADGKTLRAVTAAGNLLAWTIPDGQETARHALGDANVVSAAFSPDGATLACSLKDHTLLLTETATGKALRRLTGKKATHLTLAFTADGQTLAAGNGYEPTRLWQVATGKLLGELPPPRGWLHALAFAPDGKTLACGDRHAVRQWDVTTRAEVLPTDAAVTQLTTVALAADGRTGLTSDLEGQATVWDLPGGQRRLSVRDPQYRLGTAALSPGGDRVATGGWDGAVRLWDAATGKQVQRLTGHARDVNCLAFAADGKTLASGGRDHSVRLWDTTAGKQLRTLTCGAYRPRGLCFAPDGGTLATVSIEDGLRSAALHLWDVATGQGRLVDRAADAYGADFVAFSPDGRLLAVGGGAWSVGPWRVKVFEAAGGGAVWERQPAADSPEARSIVTGLAFAADGRTLVVAHAHEVRFLDAVTGHERRRLTGHAGQVLALALSGDGRTLLTGGSDTTALLWDAAPLLTAARPAAQKLSAAELQTAWARLADGAAAPAVAAVRSLAAAPEQALPWLTQQLKPVPPLDQAAAAKWLAQLDDKRFAVREQAAAALERHKDVLVPVLRKWLAGTLPPETRRRLEQLAVKVDPATPGPELLRAVRAVWALEQMDTPAARKLLASYAAGALAARLTREAQAALRRLPAAP